MEAKKLTPAEILALNPQLDPQKLHDALEFSEGLKRAGLRPVQYSLTTKSVRRAGVAVKVWTVEDIARLLEWNPETGTYSN